MNTQAAMDLIETRARTNGWGEWGEVCAAAGIDGGPMTFKTDDGRALWDALRRRGVRISDPHGEPVRFRAPL